MRKNLSCLVLLTMVVEKLWAICWSLQAHTLTTLSQHVCCSFHPPYLIYHCVILSAYTSYCSDQRKFRQHQLQASLQQMESIYRGEKRRATGEQEDQQRPSKRRDANEYLKAAVRTRSATIASKSPPGATSPNLPKLGRSNSTSAKRISRWDPAWTARSARSLLADTTTAMSINDDLEDGEIVEDPSVPATTEAHEGKRQQPNGAPSDHSAGQQALVGSSSIGPRGGTPSDWRVGIADTGRSMAPPRRAPGPETLHRAMRDVLEHDKVRCGHIIKAAVYEESTDHKAPTTEDQPPPENYCYHQGVNKPWILVKIRYFIVVAKHLKVFVCIPMYTRHGKGTGDLGRGRRDQYISVKDWRWQGERYWDEQFQRYVDREYEEQSDRYHLLAERMKEGEPVLHAKSVAWLAHPVSITGGMHGYIVGMLSQRSFLHLEKQLRDFAIPGEKGIFSTWSGPEDGESEADRRRRHEELSRSQVSQASSVQLDYM